MIAGSLVRQSNDEQRPYVIAIANLTTGIIGIPFALLAGLIAQERGAIIALAIMAALNIVTATYARILPNAKSERAKSTSGKQVPSGAIGSAPVEKFANP